MRTREQMQQDFIANNGAKPKRQPKERAATKRRTRIKPVSEKQAAKKEDWKLIREAMVYAQLRTNGFYSCMVCGIVVEAPRMLDLDHISATGRGGKWEPGNAQLSCNRFSPNGQDACHVVKHGRPEFSGSKP